MNPFRQEYFARYIHDFRAIDYNGSSYKVVFFALQLIFKIVPQSAPLVYVVYWFPFQPNNDYTVCIKL